MNKKILFKKNFYASKKQDYGIMISRSKKLLPYILPTYLTIYLCSKLMGIILKELTPFARVKTDKLSSNV